MNTWKQKKLYIVFVFVCHILVEYKKTWTILVILHIFSDRWYQNKSVFLQIVFPSAIHWVSQSSIVKSLRSPSTFNKTKQNIHTCSAAHHLISVDNMLKV